LYINFHTLKLLSRSKKSPTSGSPALGIFNIFICTNASFSAPGSYSNNIDNIAVFLKSPSIDSWIICTSTSYYWPLIVCSLGKWIAISVAAYKVSSRSLIVPKQFYIFGSYLEFLNLILNKLSSQTILSSFGSTFL